MFTYFNTYFLQFPALDKIFTGVKNCNITNEYYCYNVFITAETWYCVHSNQSRIERAKIVILQGHNLLRGGGGRSFCLEFFCLFVQKVILLLFLAQSQNLVGITTGSKVVQMQTSHILLSTIVIRSNNRSVCLPKVPHCG